MRAPDYFFAGKGTPWNEKNPNEQIKGKKNPLKWLVANPGIERWKVRNRRSHSGDKDENTQFHKRSLRRYKDTLVYLEGSPDYCNVDASIG